MFSLLLGFKGIKRNFFSYIRVILLTLSCTTVICILLSAIFSFLDHYGKILLNSDVSYITVSVTDPEYMGFGVMSHYQPMTRGIPQTLENAILTMDDINYIDQNFGKKIGLKVVSSGAGYAVNRENGAEDEYMFSVYYVTDAYYKDIGIDPCIIIPSRIRAALVSQNAVDYSQESVFFCEYDSEKQRFVTLVNRTAYDDVLTETIDLKMFDDFGFTSEVFWDGDEYVKDDYLLRKAIIMPISILYDCYQENFRFNTKIRIQSNGNMKETSETLKYLNQSHDGKYIYSFEPTAFQLRYEIEEQQKSVFLLIPGLALLLVVVGISFLGIQIIQFEQRKRGLAIASALGATNRHLSIEALVKGCIPPLLGGVISCILTQYVLLNFKIKLLDVIFKPSLPAMFITLFLCLLLGVLSTLPTLIKLYRLSPVEVLKG